MNGCDIIDIVIDIIITRRFEGVCGARQWKNDNFVCGPLTPINQFGLVSNLTLKLAVMRCDDGIAIYIISTYCDELSDDVNDDAIVLTLGHMINLGWSHDQP